MSLPLEARRAAALLKHAAKNIEKAPQFVRTAADWLAHGAPLASDAVLKERQATCGGDGSRPKCDHWKPIDGSENEMHCAVCKCTSWKLNLATAACPLDKWKAVR